MILEMRLRHYSERSIASYVSALAKLAVYYHVSPDTLTREQVKDYAYHLITHQSVSVSTINQLISAWKILQVDVLGHQWESLRIKRPRKDKKLPQVLSQQEALKLVHTPLNFKHRTLLMLTYACGLRRAEVLHIKPGDIDASRQIVRVVNGKGHKSRELPLTGALIHQLREYYRQYRPQTYLFEGTTPGKPYSETSFAKVISNAAIKSGIKKKPSPHVLRHCFATHMLEKGVNLKRLQLLLGHHSMKTTSVYLHLTQPEVNELPDLLNIHQQ